MRKHFANIVVNGSPPTPASEAEPPSNRCQFSSKKKQNIFHECPESPLFFGYSTNFVFIVFFVRICFCIFGAVKSIPSHEFCEIYYRRETKDWPHLQNGSYFECLNLISDFRQIAATFFLAVLNHVQLPPIYSVWISIDGKVFVCRATTPRGEINNNNTNKIKPKNLQYVDIYRWQSVCV